MSDPDQGSLTRGGRKKRASLSLVAEWVKKSFDSISMDTIINGFDKALLDDPNDDDISERVDIDYLNSAFSPLNV